MHMTAVENSKTDVSRMLKIQITVNHLPQMMLEMTFLGWKTEFEGSSWINVFNDDDDEEEENSFHLDIITDKDNILF